VVTNPQEVAKATQVKFDPYTNFYSVSGMNLDLGGFPNITKTWMRGGFDKSGKNEYIQLYVYHWSQTGWKFLSEASDITGTRLIVHRLDREVNYDAAVEEHIAIDLPRDFLESRKTQGLNIRVLGSKGSLIVEVPGSYIVGFLERFDSAVALQHSGGASLAMPTGRPVLGVQYIQVTASLASTLNMGEPRGVMVVAVTQGSAAEHAGIKQGDVILKYGDKAMNAIPDLQAAVASSEPGTTVPIIIWRRGSEVTVSVRF
jgi:membrane-associated protease RseP (regulator of RpoE activity)